MCGGVEAEDKLRAFERVKVYFPNPKAAFPVLLEDGTDLGWVRWGRRREEPGDGPQGGWARADTLASGGWDRYRPQRAFGIVERFMEKDASRVSHWFELAPDQALHCLVIGEGESRRVYVVTREPPPEFAWVHDRWPLLAQVA